MIKRINLIEKKAFSFTYLRLVQLCLLVVGLNFIFVGFQVLNVQRLTGSLATQQEQLKQLEQKRDVLMKQPSKTRVSVGQYQDLLDRIQNTPKWSILLSDLTNRLPNTAWITNFRTVTQTANVGGSVEVTPKDKKRGEGQKDKDAAVQTAKVNGIELDGLSADMRNITEFTAKLAQSDHFNNLVLSEASRQAFGYAFKIKSEVNLNVR